MNNEAHRLPGKIKSVIKLTLSLIKKKFTSALKVKPERLNENSSY
jgi:hypothetical protein